MKTYSTWIPNQPASKGATAYHDAVVNTSWHKENIRELIKIIRKKIKSDDVIVDFGAGTGTSTIYLFKTFKDVKFLAVDKSASWLTNAYELLNKNKNVYFYLVKKKGNKFIRLDKLIGEKIANHVLSFNTIHLISDIDETFKGIYASLKKGGIFSFQSGNIILKKRENGILMIDDSINAIHDLAIEIIYKDSRFKKYKNGLAKRIKEQAQQRTTIFPNPRTLEFYIKVLKSVGFKNEKTYRKKIRIEYNDWLDFLRVKRLQAGILPEVGGRYETREENIDRDVIITKASKELFNILIKNNPLANSSSFFAEWVYVLAEK